MFKFMMDRMVGAAEYVVGSGIVGFYLVFVDPREGLASTEAELNPTPNPISIDKPLPPIEARFVSRVASSLPRAPVGRTRSGRLDIDPRREAPQSHLAPQPFEPPHPRHWPRSVCSTPPLDLWVRGASSSGSCSDR